jgi:ABC-2 type transport system ATP-binding protein
MTDDVQVALALEGFGRRYRRTRPWAVRDVTLTIPRGSVTALVGPNGAGKSTLLRACLAFERPDEGRVLVCGFDPQRDRSAAVESIGYVPQAAALYRNLTIEDHLVMAAAARALFDRAYAQRRVRDAGLNMDRKLGELSGGEQAQVGLALALATRAPLLLLDEPLASLDPLARRDFMVTLVDHVRSHGTTVVLSSHIVTDVEHGCDSLIVLGGGRLLLHSDIASALRAFMTVAQADLDGASPIGTFAGTSGEHLALVPSGRVGRTATLEEIVLGHLANVRIGHPIEEAV